jgi:glycerol-3-phosphate acyltransferase PlsY
MGAAATLPVFVALTPHRGDTALIWFAVILAFFVIWAHRANMRRLLRGIERRFGKARGDDANNTDGADPAEAGP